MSFTDNITKALLQKVSKVASTYGVEVQTTDVSASMRKLFKLPDTTTIGIVLPRADHMGSMDWEKFTTRISKLVTKHVGDASGVLKIEPVMIGGTAVKTIVLKSMVSEQLTESAHILNTLVKQVLTNFKYAEEVHYEENGERCPYKLTMMPAGAGSAEASIWMELDTGSNNRDWAEARGRLRAFADTFLEEEAGVFKVHVHQSRMVGKFILDFSLDRM